MARLGLSFLPACFLQDSTWTLEPDWVSLVLTVFILLPLWVPRLSLWARVAHARYQGWGPGFKPLSRKATSVFCFLFFLVLNPFCVVCFRHFKAICVQQNSDLVAIPVSFRAFWAVWPASAFFCSYHPHCPHICQPSSAHCSVTLPSDRVLFFSLLDYPSSLPWLPVIIKQSCPSYQILSLKTLYLVHWRSPTSNNCLPCSE